MEDIGGLTREKWLNEALRILAESGHEALRAEPLAKRLGVSRGSFYWHFKDVPSFLKAVLGRWELAAFEQPLARVARGNKAHATELMRLIDIAFTEAPTLERAVRGWAAVYAPAAATVAIVDRRRTTRLTAMFEQEGAPSPQAEASARILYWAYIGCILSADLPISASTMTEVRVRLGSARMKQPNEKPG